MVLEFQAPSGKTDFVTVEPEEKDWPDPTTDRPVAGMRFLQRFPSGPLHPQDLLRFPLLDGLGE